jgi:SAM-dependent methyltransferase
MRSDGIDAFEGTIEDFLSDEEASKRQFDIVTIMWTLENCSSCRTMIDAAYNILRPGGHLLVATGSRILVPFKKPLQYYIGNDKWGDTHPFRFSANSLRGLLAGSGFATTEINRFFDTDYLVVAAQKTDGAAEIPWKKDNYQEVIDFFDRWHAETRDHLAHF